MHSYASDNGGSEMMKVVRRVVKVVMRVISRLQRRLSYNCW